MPATGMVYVNTLVAALSGQRYLHQNCRIKIAPSIVINNAGIGRGGALEVTPVAEIRKLMEVNVIGLMAVTQAFIPMLRKGKGRIINIGSTSSLLAFPGASVYCASKFAVEALSDALRVEVKPFGINVVIIEPERIESEWRTIATEHLLKVSRDTVYKEIAENIWTKRQTQ